MIKSPSPILREALLSAMRGILFRAYSAANGDVTIAARSLQVSRTSFYNLAKRYGVSIARARQRPCASK